MQQCIKICIIPYLNEAQHVSGNTLLIIRSLKPHKQPLVLHTWKVVGRVVVGHCQLAYEIVQKAPSYMLEGCRMRSCWTLSSSIWEGAECTLSYATWQRPTTTRPTTFHICKTRGCLCSFRLLMMGSVLPETCWASFKYGIIKIFIHCCSLLGFSVRIELASINLLKYCVCM